MGAANKPLVLIVDDQPINIRLLKIKLEREGYDVDSVLSGPECLDYVKSSKPDIILLDVMMPGMDGIETCEHLKKNPATSPIPVIFITAKSSKESKILGFNTGAIDYITKPIDLDETVARVSAHANTQKEYRESLALQEKLYETKRQSASEAITHGIAHSLNNLSGVLLGHLSMLKMCPDDPQQVTETAKLMEEAVQSIADVASELRKILDKKILSTSPTLLSDITTSILNQYANRCQIELITNTPNDLTIPTHRKTLDSILNKLLDNACDAAPDSPIKLITDIKDNHLEITVQDSGKGLDAEISDKLFDPFVSTHFEVGRGLGLTTARHLSEALNATLTLEPNATGGTSARITHPL